MIPLAGAINEGLPQATLQDGCASHVHENKRAHARGRRSNLLRSAFGSSVAGSGPRAVTHPSQ